MKLLTAVCLLLSIQLLSAQETWTDLIDADLTYGEILDAAEVHFDATGRGRGSGYKQFLRWKSLMDARATPDATLMNYNVLNAKAYQQALSKSPVIRSTTGSWENIGPFDQYGSSVSSSGGLGRVICTALHPSNSAIMWVGTAAGGVWKTTNAGADWTPLTDAFASIGISAIVVNQTDPNTIYILTGDGRASDSPSIGVLKTTNGGVTWATTDLTFSASQYRYGHVLVAHPTNANILFAAINDNGLYRTANGGTTFTQEIQGDTTIWDVEFIPGDPNKVLASSNKGLLRSNDGGLNWFVDNDPAFPTTFSCMKIGTSPSVPQNVYAIFDGNTGVNGTFRGCFKSTNYGSTFTMMSTTPNIFGWDLGGGDSGDQGARDMAFTVDPGNDARLFAGGVNVWKSEDSGATWGRETWWTHNFEPSDPFVHADQQNFYWLGTTLIANNDGGIYKTEDYGNDWSDLSQGLAIGQFYEIDVHDSDYIGGMQDNGTMEGSFANPQSHQILGGDGFGCSWSAGNPNVRFLSTQESIIRREAGSNIIIWDGQGDMAFWETEIEMHTTNTDDLFLDKGNALYRGHEEFFIWNYVWEDLNTDSKLSNDRIRGYAQGTSNPDVMYVVNLDSIIKTTNLSASTPTWTVLTDPATGGARPYDVTVDPANANRVWVAYTGYQAGQKVYYSDNGGSSWTNISGTIENVPIRCIAYVGGTNSGLYIGTEIGVYYLGDALSDWVPFANYLPNTVIADIEILNGYVYAGTHGRGIWRSPLYTTCPTTLTLTPANDLSNPNSPGTQYHYASQSINSTRVIAGGPLETEIYYTAGNWTDLLPGFEAKNGGYMEIAVGGCPD